MTSPAICNLKTQLSTARHRRADMARWADEAQRDQEPSRAELWRSRGLELDHDIQRLTALVQRLEPACARPVPPAQKGELVKLLAIGTGSLALSPVLIVLFIAALALAPVVIPVACLAVVAWYSIKAVLSNR